MLFLSNLKHCKKSAINMASSVRMTCLFQLLLFSISPHRRTFKLSLTIDKTLMLDFEQEEQTILSSTCQYFTAETVNVVIVCRM